MKLVEINWNPTHRQLRQFAIVCLFALPLVGWIWGLGFAAVALLAVAGLVLAFVGVLFPTGVKPIFLALSIVAAPIGIIIGELAMLLIYYGVFLPIGLGFRLAKRDALQLKFDRQAKTYWQAKKRPNSLASYYRQF
jgi:hypothetical protein